VGLDLGTTEFRSIRDSGGDLVARRCRAAYLVVKDTPGHRRLVEHAQARHATCGDDLVVLGDDAFDCATMLDLPVTSLLPDGHLPKSDPVARQILALMVEAVLPPAETASVCCVTLPGGYGLDGDTQSLDVRFLKQLVSLRGYTPQLVSSGLAAVLAELSCSSFSGLGISLGATNCEVSVVHCGRELARCTVAGKLAEFTEELAIGTSTKGGSPAWESHCLKALTAILAEARESLEPEGSMRLLSQPANVVCTGGITMATGFETLLQQAWQQANWPLRVAQIRIAGNRFTIARGGLIKAILEGQPIVDRRVA
jgi:hypothetical protein